MFDLRVVFFPFISIQSFDLKDKDNKNETAGNETYMMANKKHRIGRKKIKIPL